MAIAEALNQSLVEALGIPRGDRFVMLSERGEDELYIDPDFMGMQRSDKAMIITVLLGAHRGQDDKTALQAAERVEAHPDDVFAALVPVPNENFSFGRGIAQLMGGAPRW
ncbi:tautomerase family protein [Burkholderia gladioli]|uniref:tautomerase family protein n=1 Tax=Burkholderia gladioli TaxID=28095 RepID=UPI001FC8DDEF